jgi:predicted enzyme related to lactoylglutathione lyase
MSAPVVQWQMVASNPDELVRFYRDLFGWEISTKNAMGYRQVKTGEGGINGGVWPSPPGAHSFVQLFVSVPDVDRAVARATELGAAIIVPSTILPDGDQMAVLKDPCGVTFGVVGETNLGATATPID